MIKQEISSLEQSLQWMKTPVQYLKGVGPHIASLLAKMNVVNFEDYLYHLPFRYLDRRNIASLRELQPGKNQCVVAEVHSATEVAMRKGRKKIFEVIFTDGRSYLIAKWFRYSKPYLQKRFQTGAKFILFGEVSFYGRERQMLHPEAQPIQDVLEENELQQFLGYVPIYPSTEGLIQKRIRKNLEALLEQAGAQIFETLPSSLREKYQLLPLAEALQRVHQPKPQDSFPLQNQRSPYHRRLVFCEFFYLQLGLALRQNKNYKREGFAHQDSKELVPLLLKKLPFELTQAQKKAFEQIRQDMILERPMNRLLQGDVGSGKTIVCLLASLLAVENQRQIALMAPTEILAEQHYRGFQRFLSEFNVEVLLLTASTSTAQKKLVLKKIQEGQALILIGTHALLEEEVSFDKLSLAIIDEQHRFGVKQRMQLMKKAHNPDVLALTATPIPRSLAMTVYGDLDVSVMRELPGNRKPIQTRIMKENDRPKLYDFIRKKLQEGRQAYFVFPLIEKSEKVDLRDATEAFEKLKKIFPEFSIALLHGRMKSQQKEEIMQEFSQGKTQILVATTVIEVGIDVPNATIMVIEHAERFGLSQLHQLRGRVGRGSEKSYCILAPDYKKTHLADVRLRVIESSTDGFKIAEEDLELRGPGDFLGTRQSGLPDLRVANLVTDLDILEEAKQAVSELLQKDPELQQPEHAPLKSLLKHRWEKRLGLAEVG